MRTALYVGAIVIGVIIAQLGSEPVWIVAVAALLAFPLAAAAVVSATPAGGSRRAPVGTGLLTGLSGGILAGLLVRLAVAAPGWENATNADCGGASTATQQIVLWGAAVVFVLALLPVGMTLAGIGIRVGSGRAGLAPKVPLSLYPLAVAASGLALIGAGFATNC